MSHSKRQGEPSPREGKEASGRAPPHQGHSPGPTGERERSGSSGVPHPSPRPCRAAAPQAGKLAGSPGELRPRQSASSLPSEHCDVMRSAFGRDGGDWGSCEFQVKALRWARCSPGVRKGCRFELRAKGPRVKFFTAYLGSGFDE